MSTAGAATTRWAARDALDGMARHLLRHGVTSFLPTAVTAPLAEPWSRFAERVRAWLPVAPADGAEPLGFNLEGPFLAAGTARRPRPRPPARPGRRRRAGDLEPLARRPPPDHDRAGAARRARPRSAGCASGAWRCRWATRPRRLDEARAGYRGRRHVDDPPVQRDERRGSPRAGPGCRRAARRRRLRRADRRRRARPSGAVAAHHPDQASDRLLLVSDAIALAGIGDGRGRSAASRSRSSAGASRWPGRRRWPAPSSPSTPRSAISSQSGVPLPAAVAAASRNPLAMLGITDRGRIAVGQRADLVELDDDLQVRRVMRAGHVVATDSARRHRLERPLDVVEHAHRRLGHDRRGSARRTRPSPRARRPRCPSAWRDGRSPAPRRRTRCGPAPGS